MIAARSIMGVAATATLSVGAQDRPRPTFEPYRAPAVEARSYAYECPDGGRYRLDIDRRHGGHTMLTRLQAGARRLEDKVESEADARLARFLYVENVTLRCEVGGGAQFVVSGAASELRSEGVRDRAAFVIRVSARGQVDITD